MICELIVIAGISLNPCNVDMLKMSFSEPSKRCYLKMKDGSQHNVKLPCTDVLRVMSENEEIEELKGWEV